MARVAAKSESASEETAFQVRQAIGEESVVVEEPLFLDEDGVYEPSCDSACCCADPCGCPPCNGFGGGLWVNLDFLLWWRDRREFPALVTTTPDPNPNPADVLFGGAVDEPARPGGRLEVGLWLDPWQRTAIGGRYLAVGDATISPKWSSDDGLPFIARPFTDVSTNPVTPTAFPIANNSAVPPTTGRIGINSGSEVYVSDAFFYWTLLRSPCHSFGFQAGYQFARINEDLVIDSFTRRDLGNNKFESYAVTDLFDANNEFHGGHFGLRGDYRCGRFGVEMLARFAFGNMRQTVNVAGATITTDVDGGTDERDYGLLAQASTNGGLHLQNDFSFMNEAGIKLAFYPVEHLKLSVGYSLLHWSSVVRPGGHLDTSVDGVPSPADATRPAFAFNPSDYIVQGLNFGAEFRF
ncbi:MAG: BBP7 family outer membrane beta-barrel protein [Candidatus Anammoximicrobium sp.]|nr:BBP7 family outer membrane beta-barrel protein [Candidatus Anammoximicrobium sp.]